MDNENIGNIQELKAKNYRVYSNGDKRIAGTRILRTTEGNYKFVIPSLSRNLNYDLTLG